MFCFSVYVDLTSPCADLSFVVGTMSVEAEWAVKVRKRIKIVLVETVQPEMTINNSSWHGYILDLAYNEASSSLIERKLSTLYVTAGNSTEL